MKKRFLLGLICLPCAALLAVPLPAWGQQTTQAHKVEVTFEARIVDTFEGIARSVHAGTTARASIGHGTGANQADDVVQDTNRSLTSSNFDDLDLFDLAGFDATTNPLGNTVTVTEVVGILVVNRSSSTGDLTVGGQASAAAWNAPFDLSDTAKVRLKPGGIFFLAAPTDPAYAVTDGTNHLLRMLAVGGDVTYDVYLFVRKS